MLIGLRLFICVALCALCIVIMHKNNITKKLFYCGAVVFFAVLFVVLTLLPVEKSLFKYQSKYDLPEIVVDRKYYMDTYDRYSGIVTELARSENSDKLAVRVYVKTEKNYIITDTLGSKFSESEYGDYSIFFTHIDQNVDEYAVFANDIECNVLLDRFQNE